MSSRPARKRSQPKSTSSCEEFEDKTLSQKTSRWGRVESSDVGEKNTVCHDQKAVSSKLQVLLVVWGNKRLAIRRFAAYKDAIAALRNSDSMKALKTQSFHLEAILPGISPSLCEITEDVWPDVVSSLATVFVVLTENTGAASLGRAQEGQVAAHRRVFIKNLTGKRVALYCSPSDSIRELKRQIQDAFGVPVDEQRLVHSGTQLADGSTIEESGIIPEDELHLVCKLRGGKPVIYVLSPEVLKDVTVSLQLIPSWSFSAIYPTAGITRNNQGEKIEWTVDTAQDGTLLDKSSGLRVSYLYWEAKTHPAMPLTPVSSRPSSPNLLQPTELNEFDPSRPYVSPKDAVLLSIDKIPTYLDSALESLTLHTEARTSFITYWLPSLLKHKNIALQFLPQMAYEAAAPMNISPAPAVVTRVFMVFRGVEDDKLSDWEGACMRAARDVAFWTEVVGIDVERASNDALYRVLEWGGMEVC